LYLLMLLMVLFSARRAAGETTMSDTVCVGTTKPYWVNPVPGSTYLWKLDGVTQTPTITTDSVIISWNTLGDFELTVQEKSIDNCFGDVKLLKVHVKNDPPTFIPPVLSSGYCVEDITVAEYDPAGSYDDKTDLIPPRPDYYLLPFESTLLDITGISDDCPGTLTISWVIDFEGVSPPDLTGNGQISDAIPPGGIQFPVGTNVITWTVTDAAGSTTVHSVTLVVLPRPDIGDIPP
jgi:hypothetical protein